MQTIHKLVHDRYDDLRATGEPLTKQGGLLDAHRVALAGSDRSANDGFASWHSQ